MAFSVAALQVESSYGDNRDRLERETERVLARFPWVRMVVFPELCSFGPGLSFAEAMPGPTETRYQELAKKHGVWLIPGSIYERAGEDIFNTAPVISPAGEVIARYRKMYPFLPYEKGVKSGNEFVVFDVPEVGRFGVSICYDGWVPETTRALVWKGAEVILHPTMTGTIDRTQELIIAQASAITNQCYFVDVNGAGQLGNGRSIIVGPEGEIIHQSGEVGEQIPFTVDLGRVQKCANQVLCGSVRFLSHFATHRLTFPATGANMRNRRLWLAWGRS